MTFSLDKTTKIELVDYLSGFATENRIKRFENVLSKRTKYLTIVLEDIFQPHNISAVLRTCDCFGVQDIHIIENENPYEVNNEIALGSSNWLDIYRYNSSENNTLECINKLKKENYKIIATSPHKNDVLIDELDLSNKTALIFGTEKDGLTNEVLNNADGFVKIPMYGFTESFNISVSAALCLHTLTEKIRKSNYNWQLSEEEQLDIMINWLRQTIKASENIINKFLNNKFSDLNI